MTMREIAAKQRVSKSLVSKVLQLYGNLYRISSPPGTTSMQLNTLGLTKPLDWLDSPWQGNDALCKQRIDASEVCLQALSIVLEYIKEVEGGQRRGDKEADRAGSRWP
ncbi:hypothetical protein FIBSPDRAFT_850553 [Athelia psychrophila]|uniref:Uncharacterized protein n=1 Tax=Athelia psychrophila TaxID=1759441 RepID=A0A166T736_9AGAM|nr:hypothetical protein FIBSPDRAFT_850553 [Fibularhizoctonia sp. CBS 109695]